MTRRFERRDDERMLCRLVAAFKIKPFRGSDASYALGATNEATLWVADRLSVWANKGEGGEGFAHSDGIQYKLMNAPVKAYVQKRWQQVMGFRFVAIGNAVNFEERRSTLEDFFERDDESS